MKKMIVGDMFAGAGGTSHGIVNSKFAEVAWAINHDANAIKAHKQNQQDQTYIQLVGYHLNF